MDRCAIFVDAGYLLATAPYLCLGPVVDRSTTRERAPRRGEFTWQPAELIGALANYVCEHCKLPLLRIYWYDGARHRQPTWEQQTIARLPDVKVRVGNLSGGEQKGVDSLIVRDLITLAQERAMTTAYLVSGDEDVREGLRAAQDVGIRVLLLGIPPLTPSNPNQADSLIEEADGHLLLDGSFLVPYFSKPASATLGFTPPGLVEALTEAGEEVSSTDDLIATPTQSSDVQIASERGRLFAGAWANTNTSESVRALLQRSPVIPSDLDIQLLTDLQSILGPLDYRPDIRKDARRAFWQKLRDIERASKTTEEE